MTSSEKVAFLKGLTEGMGIDVSAGEGKIIKGILDVLADIADDVAALEDNAEGLGEELDAVAADVAALENEVYDDYDEDECDCDDDCDCDDCCDCDDEIYTVTCPVCNFEFALDEDTILKGTFKCPECGEKLEFEFDEDDECDCGCHD